MAKNLNPFTCDECQIAKQPSNGWFLLMQKHEARINLRDRGYETDLDKVGVLIIAWDEKIADMYEGVKHICGIDCLLKQVGKSLIK